LVGQIILGGIAVLSVLLVVMAWSLARIRRRLRQADNRAAELAKRFAGVIDVEDHIAAERRVLQELRVEAEQLRDSYAQKRAMFARLDHEMAALTQRLDYAELGLYEPNPELGSSATYTGELNRIRARQREMVADGRAAICGTTWMVDGDRRKGQTMATRAIRLVLRAFNNECEVLVSKISWSNVASVKERMIKSKETLDKLNQSNSVTISNDYLALKLEEADITFRERSARRQEQEQLREERAAVREEERAQREIEAEIRRTQREEAMRREALVKARAELAAASGAEHDRLGQQVLELEAKLAAVQFEKDRAISMAQQTRVGYVYVVSNIGSFGTRVVKVGMTRRVEPLDRVTELGDASVPFPFDVHALVFTHDAPALERRLHQLLEAHRMNRVNLRKEFFAVDIERVAEVLSAELPGATFKLQPEAEQYHRSLKGPELAKVTLQGAADEFPASLDDVA
jgi:hypothetical protein